MALVSYINEQGDVTEVCVGTNKKNDKGDYRDYYGQVPYLWCTVALLEEITD
ncbi:hypothetical protein [Olivibacter sp. SDN3]|uniref:hypothetical protein n=1 Tax=Olivibacter sp. SDN3 TaxID=2764720 RepID=UPI001C9E686E|nr:hypothetical protein [Olivibacter sp. SDN3]